MLKLLNRVRSLCGALLLPLLIVCGLNTNCVAQSEPSLSLIRTFKLANVEGRIDHMDFDSAGHRLFVAALGNNSIEVYDAVTGTQIRSIYGCKEPQGIVFVAKSNTLFVACGGDGTVRMYDALTFHLKKSISLGDDADNLRYDAENNIVYAGYGTGGIAALDATEGTSLFTIGVDGHPESFQIDKRTGTMFVNVPARKEVGVIDLHSRSVTSRFPLDKESGNFPMALDEKGRVLYVGCRTPPRMLAFDVDSRTPIERITISRDVDDIFFDPQHSCCYLTCGDGHLVAVRKDNNGTFTVTENLATAPGARTGLFVPHRNEMYIAVPADGDDAARILVYATGSR